MELFPRDRKDGIFRGFREGGLEFHADLTLPYSSELQSVPMHGQFLLVQLESPEEAVLGRIASFSSDGKLASGAGEEYNIRAMQDERVVGDDLRERYLRYRVNIRVLGVVRIRTEATAGAMVERLQFVPSHRRLPHVGSKVAFPSVEILRELAGHEDLGAQVGHFALGEYVYWGEDAATESPQPWMQVQREAVRVHFDVQNLVARRSFIFARAGFGKSNLNKLLFSELYRTPPTRTKGPGKHVPVGTLIFDPDGEYFWPDDSGRPGLCDVEWLKDQLVVFTNREAPSDYYGSWVLGGIKLDIRQLAPSDVISIALDVEKQSQQNVAKMRGMNAGNWAQLVDLVHRDRYSADESAIARLLGMQPNGQNNTWQAEAGSARSHVANIIALLHDPASQTLDLVIGALREGKIVVVDLSQMRGRQGLVLSGIILRKIFENNQREFTSADRNTIPTIAVLEEAQSVLQEGNPACEPYISWVKEGRKYDLGALLVTQQPGSIPTEILSQGDNWFIFHLLSATDLQSVNRANAHFGDDLLSSLLNEPLQGQGLTWSSASQKSYPIPFRVGSFDARHSVKDLHRTGGAIDTHASRLRKKVTRTVSQLKASARLAPPPAPDVAAVDLFGDDGVEPQAADPTQGLVDTLVAALKQDDLGRRFLETDDGAAWGALNAFIRERLPDHVPASERGERAFNLSMPVFDALFGGARNATWESYRHGQANWVRRKR